MNLKPRSLTYINRSLSGYLREFRTSFARHKTYTHAHTMTYTRTLCANITQPPAAVHQTHTQTSHTHTYTQISAMHSTQYLCSRTHTPAVCVCLNYKYLATGNGEARVHRRSSPQRIFGEKNNAKNEVENMYMQLYMCTILIPIHVSCTSFYSLRTQHATGATHACTCHVRTTIASAPMYDRIQPVYYIYNLYVYILRLTDK